jgi:hypothetical protein
VELEDPEIIPHLFPKPAAIIRQNVLKIVRKERESRERRGTKGK